MAATRPTTRPAVSMAVEDTSSAVLGQLSQRYRGLLLGLAIGDALGMPVQHRRRGTFTPVGDLLAGGPFDLPRGAWTDDTAQVLCLAESLVECGQVDLHDLQAPTRARSAGSSDRNSSGRRKLRSRKRPLTERNSTVTPALGPGVDRGVGASETAAGEGASARFAEVLA